MNRTSTVLRMGLATAWASALLLSTALAGDPTAAALAKIDGAKILADVKMLASDDFEGRSAGTHGEEVTIDYLVKRFKQIGLAPGNPDGTYLQNVPMIAYLSKPTVHFTLGTEVTALKTPDDVVGFTSVRSAQVNLKDSPLVFVGYGIQAPEFGWDDYKGLDVRGKTIVMLINDPPIADPTDPTKLDPKMFGGKAMTYYGRWTYKYEIAAKLGAAAAIIIHETGPAAYPFTTVISSWNGENYSLNRDGVDPDFPSVAAWITEQRGRELLAKSGLDFDTLKKQALEKSFRPVILKSTVTFEIQNSWRELTSHNVVARVPGSDPKRRAETVIYSAHWDHFGWNKELPGPKTQQIFHGAYDNATGTASLIALGEAFKSLPKAPGRSVLFIATTGEERGLLGAGYYAKHPLYPLKDTVANINMDEMNPLGPTRDIEIVGYGKSDMDDLATKIATQMNRTVIPERKPERGSVFRADQLQFARVGVPVLYTKMGQDFIGNTSGNDADWDTEFVANRYHQTGDVVQPFWTLQGDAEDTRLLWRVGYELASGSSFPQWKPGAEFKAIRDATMAGK